MEVRGKVFGVIGDKYSTINQGKEVYVLDHINKYTNKDKIIEALKMVNLSEDYLLKKSNNLSTVEYNKLSLVNSLLNKEDLIILDHFEKGLCHKEREYFKRLIRKLSKQYGIDFAIKTNDFTFCFDLVDEYDIFKNGSLIKRVDKKDAYREEIYKHYDKHQLIDFVLLSRKKGYLKDDYYSVNEVIKAVYRELVWDIF